MAKPMDRRDFMRTAAAVGASIALPRAATNAAADDTSAAASPSIAAESTPQTSLPLATRLVQVSASNILDANHRPDAERLAAMTARGVRELTGATDLQSAWQHLLTPDDVVGIKINGWGGRHISSKKSMLLAVIEGARLAGIPDERIIVWDHVGTNLARYVNRRRLQSTASTIRFKACTAGLDQESWDDPSRPPGFDTEPVEFPWGTVRVAELVTNELTAIINLAVIKDHNTSGISGVMKNISHAVVDTPWLCHDNACNPYIADICNIPAVRDKIRLHVLDAVLGVAVGGPALQSLDHLYVGDSILFSTDPVAVDSIGYEWITAERRKRGLDPPVMGDPLVDGAPGTQAAQTGYIATAAAIGLGTDDPERMDHVRVELP